MDDDAPLMFGPANDEVFDYFSLDGLFDDAYFPEEVDFSNVFDQMQNPADNVPAVLGKLAGYE